MFYNNPFKHFTLKTITLALSVSMLTACGGNNDDKPFNGNHKPSKPVTPTKPITPSNPVTPSKPSTQVKINISIMDKDGNPITGAVVDVAGKTATTNTLGKSQIETAISGKKSVVLVKKAGYLTTAKEIILDDEQSELIITLFKDQVTTSFESESGTNIENPQKTASVNIPANAIVDASGSAFTGNVNIAMSYYSPEELEGVQAFAQPYEGVQDDGSGNVGLMSVGVTEVKLTDNAGNKLQLNSTSKAILTFPANTVSDGATSIPLWHYDEDKKIWVEEGVATKQSDGSYKGSVSHFTLWNLDIPVEESARVKGCFKDKNGNSVNISSSMMTTGWSNSGYTTNGVFEVIVPAHKTITLYPSSYAQGNFEPISIAPLKTDEFKDFTTSCFIVDKASKPIRVELPPIARDNNKSGLTGKKISGNVITDSDGVDSDPNGDAISVTGFQVDINGDGQRESYNITDTAIISSLGALTLSRDGNYEFTPNNSSTGETVISYTISDGNGGFATADLTISINDPIDLTDIPVGSHLRGYELELDMGNGNGKETIDDLILVTHYIDNGLIKAKYESISGKKLSDGYANIITNSSYILTDKGLFRDKETFENNTSTLSSIIITESTNETIKGYHYKDNDLTFVGTYSFKDISGKDISSTLNSKNASQLQALQKLPKNERIFPNNQKCRYDNTFAINKAHIDMYITDDNQGTQTIDDLTAKADTEFNSSISGTWAGIPWVASTEVVGGYSDVFVLYKGQVKLMNKAYNRKGTFKEDYYRCEYYTKEQVDFVIDAMKKAYPELR